MLDQLHEDHKPSISADATARPNLFLVGAPKCGTSALAHYLSEHPAVFFSDPKEPFFFASDYPELKRQHFLTDEASYLRLFAGADPAQHRVIAEGSTNALASHRALDAMLDFAPQGRFIAMLRNPVDVAHAFHMEQVFARNETEPDFETAWRLQEARRAGRHIPDSCRAVQFLLYSDVATLGEQIQRFVTKIPEKQRLILLQEDMAHDTRIVYCRVLRFLGLPDDGQEHFARVNTAHRHRYEWLSDLVLSPPKSLQPAVWAFRNYARRRKPRVIEAAKSYLKLEQKRSPLRPEFRQELTEHFRPQVEQLETLLGCSLSHWKEVR